MHGSKWPINCTRTRTAEVDMDSGAPAPAAPKHPSQLAMNQVDELWVFWLVDERWEQIDTGVAVHLKKVREEHGRAESSDFIGGGDWPAARYGALVDSGWMMAGVGTHECVTSVSRTSVTRAPSSSHFDPCWQALEANCEAGTSKVSWKQCGECVRKHERAMQAANCTNALVDNFCEGKSPELAPATSLSGLWRWRVEEEDSSVL